MARAVNLTSEYERATAAVQFILARTAYKPKVGLVLGSGLGAFADELAEAVVIPYESIPHFPQATVEGHPGRLVIGKSGSVAVAVLQGRVHYYEGYTSQQVVFPVRVMALLGVRVLLLTNTAGGINPKLKPGDLLVIRDHINLQGTNPLLGPSEPRFGPRFPDMTEAYSTRLVALAHAEAKKLGFDLCEGVYAGVAGPSYETPAEVRCLHLLGADVVGMSTVPEVIVAQQMGLQVLAISCVTNLAAGLCDRKLTHEEVLAAAQRLNERFTTLLRALLPRLAPPAAGLACEVE